MYIYNTLTNKKEELPIDFCFNKIPHFTVEPSRGIIKPSYPNTISQMTIQVFFHPENIGKFADVLVMKYVNNMYEIPIRIFGVCKGGMKKVASSNTMENLSKKANDVNAGNVQYVPDELALDFTEHPRKRIDQNTKLQRMHQDRLNEVLNKIQKKMIPKHKGT